MNKISNFSLSLFTATEDEKDTQYDRWGSQLYFYTCVFCGTLLFVAYSHALVKACRGTRYAFIITLIIMLGVSSFSAVCAVWLGHRAGVLGSENFKHPEDPFDSDHFIAILDAESVFVLFRDTNLNLAIWFFCFRYWATSFTIPWQLKGMDRPRWYRATSIILFIIGCILNLLVPCLYAYYTAIIHGTFDDSEAE